MLSRESNLSSVVQSMDSTVLSQGKARQKFEMKGKHFEAFAVDPAKWTCGGLEKILSARRPGNEVFSRPPHVQYPRNDSGVGSLCIRRTYFTFSSGHREKKF